MYEKKKTTVILLIVLTLVVCGMIAVNRPILHFPFEEITIHYKTDNGIVSTKLEDNEAATIWWMLSGKPVSWNVTLQGGSGCGFGPERAITIGNTTYYVSKDGCGVLQKAGTKYFYRLSKDQWWCLWEILEAYGANRSGY